MRRCSRRGSWRQGCVEERQKWDSCLGVRLGLVTRSVDRCHQEGTEIAGGVVATATHLHI